LFFPLGRRVRGPHHRARPIFPALAAEAVFGSGPVNLVGRPVKSETENNFGFPFLVEKRNAWEKCCVSILAQKIVKQSL
jgi:hypothetical protein